MATNRVKSSTHQKKLEDYRAYQGEILKISREYSQSRLAVWVDEARSLHDTWSGFTQEWQANLASISGAVEQWGAGFLQTLGQVAAAWGSSMGSRGGGREGWSSLLGGALDFGGWFHQGGVVEAHQGMVISPGTLMGDEQLIMAQAVEGVLPRESMARLGEKNFEALRSGRFEPAGGKAAPRYDVTIQVQTLDASGVAGLDWDRLVQRHLMPALRQEADRRW